MKLATLIDHIRAVESVADLDRLEQVIRARRGAVRQQIREQAEQAANRAWAHVTYQGKGSILLLPRCADVTGWYAPPGRKTASHATLSAKAGQMFRVVLVQPRAKRVWAEDEQGGQWCLKADALGALRASCYPDQVTAQVAFHSGRALSN